MGYHPFEVAFPVTRFYLHEKKYMLPKSYVKP